MSSIIYKALDASSHFFPLVILSADSASPHEVRLAEKNVGERFTDGRPEKMIGDKASDSDPLDEQLKKLNSELTAPHKANRKKDEHAGRAQRQAIYGQTLTGAPYALNAGFWTPTGFAPTAAAVTLDGRVRAANGAGIRNVLVTLIGANGATRTVITGKFDIYSFPDPVAGETYIISVAAKRYRFAQNTQIHSATADYTNIGFVADDPNPNIRLLLNTTTPND